MTLEILNEAFIAQTTPQEKPKTQNNVVFRNRIERPLNDGYRKTVNIAETKPQEKPKTRHNVVSTNRIERPLNNGQRKTINIAETKFQEKPITQDKVLSTRKERVLNEVYGQTIKNTLSQAFVLETKKENSSGRVRILNDAFRDTEAFFQRISDESETKRTRDMALSYPRIKPDDLAALNDFFEKIKIRYERGEFVYYKNFLSHDES